MAKRIGFKRPPPKGGSRLTTGRAAAGLAAAAVAAYGAYLIGKPRSRRRPVTELEESLPLRLRYAPWRHFHYAVYSRPGSGTPIVFLHSINAVASAHEMRPLVLWFARQTGRPLYALEWLGFGHSDRPEIAYTPELLEDQLEDLLERVHRSEGAAADVVGLSLGATYAADVARRRPELVRSLVAIEPAGFGEEPSTLAEAWSKLLFSLPGVQRAFYERLTTPKALRAFARDNLFTDTFGVPEEFIRSGAETARIEGAARPLDDFLSGRLFPAQGREAFQRMRQPLLVLHGTVDERRMESYAALPELDRRPDVEVVALPTGALPHWERTDEVAERIDRFQGMVADVTPTDVPAAS